MGIDHRQYQVKTKDVSIIDPSFSMKIFLKDHMAMGPSDDIQEEEWKKNSSRHQGNHPQHSSPSMPMSIGHCL